MPHTGSATAILVAHHVGRLTIRLTAAPTAPQNAPQGDQYRTPLTIGLAASQLEQCRVALTTRLVAPHNAPHIVPEIDQQEDLSDQTVEDATSVKKKLAMSTVSCLRIIIS